MEFLKKLQAESQKLWGGLNTRQRAMYVAIAVLFVAGVAGIFAYASRPQYVVLYSEISEEEAGRVKAALDTLGERYQLDGSRILVDVRRRDALRLELSNKNVAPRGGITGYELLDRVNITETSADRETSRQRALQGEIARAIKTIEGIDDVKVILAMPPDRVFSQEQKPVTASILVTVAGYNELKPEAARSIVEFVSKAVPGLTRENVTIQDNRGRTWTPDPEEEGSLAGLNVKQQEAERKAVALLEGKLRSALGQILGDDKVAVRVNLAMDFDRVESQRTNFSKPGFDQLRESSQTTTEEFQGVGFKPGGVPGTESNLPTYEAAREMPMTYRRSEETVNYLANKEVVDRVQSPYIKRLTATISIDGTYELKRDAEGNVLERVYQPRTPEEMANLESVAKAALGFDATRGDVVAVTNLRFDRTIQFESEDFSARQELQKKKYVFSGLAGLVAVILTVMLLLELKTYLALREHKAARLRELQGREALEPALESGMTAILTLDEREKLELRKKAERAAKENPETVANLIKTWLMEEEK